MPDDARDTRTQPARLMTKKEVAQCLSVSPRQIDRLVDSGRLPLTRIRLGYRIVRFSEEEVIAAVAREVGRSEAA